MKKKLQYAGLKWAVNISSYSNGNMAVTAKSRFEEETITVNLGTDIGNGSTIQPFMAYLDTNNCPGIGKILAQAEIAEPYVRFGKPVSMKSGYCNYPLYVFNKSVLKEFDPSGLEVYEKEIKK